MPKVKGDKKQASTRTVKRKREDFPGPSSEGMMGGPDADKIAKAKGFFEEGTKNLRNGSLRLAIEKFSKAIELNPGHYAAYNKRGTARFKAGEIDEAIKDFSMAIELNPDYVNAHVNRACAYDEKGDADSALKDLTRAIKIAPKPDWYYIRAILHAKNVNFEVACDDVLRGMRLEEGYVEKYGNRRLPFSELRISKNELEGMLEKKAPGLDELRAFMGGYLDEQLKHVELGNKKFERRDDDGAIAEYTQALRLEPYDTVAYFLRALAEVKKGDYEAAIRDIRLAYTLALPEK